MKLHFCQFSAGLKLHHCFTIWAICIVQASPLKINLQGLFTPLPKITITCHHLHPIYQIHVCKHPPEAPFLSYGTKTITTVTTFIRSIRFMYATPPPEAPFSSYGTKTTTTVTTFIRSIRFMYANTPAGGSVFKLRHQDHHHCNHLHQIYQIHVCEHPRRRLRFQVTAPRPSPL